MCIFFAGSITVLCFIHIAGSPALFWHNPNQYLPLNTSCLLDLTTFR